MEQRAIQMTIESRMENVPLVGAAVRGLLGGLGWEELEGYRMELCVVEAITNAIKHSYAGAPGREVTVSLRLGPEAVEIEISNEGTGIPPGCLERRDLDYDPRDVQSLPSSGMGIYIMRSIMDEVLYSEDGGRNTLRLVKRLPGAGAVDREAGAAAAPPTA